MKEKLHANYEKYVVQIVKSIKKCYKEVDKLKTNWKPMLISIKKKILRNCRGKKEKIHSQMCFVLLDLQFCIKACDLIYIMYKYMYMQKLKICLNSVEISKALVLSY